MNRQSKNSFTSLKRSDALPPPPPSVISEAMNVRELSIEWLAGDGSDRCYYRLYSPSFDTPYVLMQLSGSDALALRENGYEWIQIGEILSRNNIAVPKTIKTLPDYAAIIIEDYGNVMMESYVLEHLETQFSSVKICYQKSFEVLRKFLNIKAAENAPWCKRSFDAPRFVWELNFFKEEYLDATVKAVLSEGDQRRFQQEAQDLADFLGSYSKHFTHRDFHSRNIMVVGSQLAIIDFQDARYGPSSYDLVSLCFDSYIPIGMDKRLHLVQEGISTISKDRSKLRTQLQDHWRPMLLQRQLKAIGSFGYLSMKKNRGNYLKYVAPALETISEDWIVDSRWPFLTKTLPALLAETLPRPLT